MGSGFQRQFVTAAMVTVILLGIGSSAQHIAAQAQSPAPSAQTATQGAPDAKAEQPQPAYSLPPDKLAKAIAISDIRNVLSITGEAWGLIFAFAFLAWRGAAGLENWAKRIAAKRWVQGILFFAGFLLIDNLASLPLDMAGHHYERAYDVSVQSWGGWAVDQAKGLGLTLLVGVPILLLFHWIVRKWPRRYWLGLWAVTLPILVCSVFVEPLIEPLFNKYEPLSAHHSALVTELEKVVARTGTAIPADRMYLMKASAKSNGLNAYVSGLGATKRVVVWDTTAGRVPDDEVMFIFGHESGHYVLRHIPKMMALSAAGLFFLYWACAHVAAWMTRRFGMRWGVDGVESRTSLVVLLFAISIASFVVQPVSNGISRHFEHQADVFGQEALHGLVPDAQKTAVAAFNALGAAWLEDPNPNAFLEFWLSDHPSTKQRAEFAAHYDPWKNNGHGEFFKN